MAAGGKDGVAGLTKEQEAKSVEYINRKHITLLFDECLEEICTIMPPNPQSHMADFLANHNRRVFPAEGVDAIPQTKHSEGGVKKTPIKDMAGDLDGKGRYEVKQMGTSGLRMKQAEYDQPGFLEQFAQGVAQFFAENQQERLRDLGSQIESDLIVVGGDPRRGNRARIDTICRCLVGNGLRVLVAKDYVASTPAISHTIRKMKAAGGIILTASHNPVGDAGIKINMEDGAPALEDAVGKIHKHQNTVTSWTHISDLGAARYEGLVREVDTVRLYADLLDEIFDLQAMSDKLQQDPSARLALDCMHGAAGPFVREVFVNRLKLKEGEQVVMVREVPRADLGGEAAHPEPDFDYIDKLIELNQTNEYSLVAAWDSDVDRRIDGGRGFWVESADEFCIFANAVKDGIVKLHELPQFANKNLYFCRSTVTAHGIDLMKEELAKTLPKPPEVVETATGFKYIAELGNWGVEESNGVGNPWLREKDGIFSTVFLLKIMLERKKSPQELMEEVWSEYGRVYFTRGEVSDPKDTHGKALLTEILNKAVNDRAEGGEAGKADVAYNGLKIEKAERWVQRGERQATADPDAWVLRMSDGNTVKARFSGTGSAGYCLRVYCSKFSQDYKQEKSSIVDPMKKAFNQFLQDYGWNGPPATKFTDAHQPDPYKS